MGAYASVLAFAAICLAGSHAREHGGHKRLGEGTCEKEWVSNLVAAYPGAAQYGEREKCEQCVRAAHGCKFCSMNTAHSGRSCLSAKWSITRTFSDSRCSNGGKGYVDDLEGCKKLPTAADPSGGAASGSGSTPVAKCEDTNDWHNPHGATCEKYAKGMPEYGFPEPFCKAGKPVEKYTSGATNFFGDAMNFPEKNCCACGKAAAPDSSPSSPSSPSTPASPASPAAPTSPTASTLPSSPPSLSGGTTEGECKDTANWRNPAGAMCTHYEKGMPEMGLPEPFCKDRKPVQKFVDMGIFGKDVNWPEKNCCACGKPAEGASAGRAGKEAESGGASRTTSGGSSPPRSGDSGGASGEVKAVAAGGNSPAGLGAGDCPSVGQCRIPSQCPPNYALGTPVTEDGCEMYVHLRQVV